ncbi:MAG: ABC transporter ATP-binding protein [Thermotogae bacterium]|nr:ABC transporter ATP-binding protein [Thermotogota bacterium]
MNGILKTENLKTFYILESLGEKKVVKAVNGVNLNIPQNEIYGIAGESGCGKSTLLKALLASLEPPLQLIEGKLFYLINGNYVDVFSFPEGKIKKLRWSYISYIPQGSMHVLNPVKKVRDTFLEFLESHTKRKDRKEYFLLASEHLKELGLSPRILDVYPHQLSGGMRQRTVIALATLLRPRIILADEPTTALDVVAQRAVIQLLKKIQREFQNTIIMVTHDMGIHAQITTRMAIMYAGKIVEEGPTNEIFSRPFHPYTKHLIQSLPKIGDKKLREGIPGSPPSLISLPSGCAFHPRCPYAFDKCKSELPELIEINSQHKVACFLNRG